MRIVIVCLKTSSLPIVLLFKLYPQGERKGGIDGEEEEEEGLKEQKE